jgi:hypothetical protein
MPKTLSRRTAVAALAAAPIAMIPTDPAGARSLAKPPAATVLNWNAALERLAQIVETLSTRHVRDGFELDSALAEQALDYCRARARGVPDDGSSDPLVEFAWTYGQSLDWILAGDLRGMICSAAARPWWREPATG